MVFASDDWGQKRIADTEEILSIRASLSDFHRQIDNKSTFTKAHERSTKRQKFKKSEAFAERIPLATISNDNFRLAIDMAQ
jgi:hypothetical protein